MGENMSDSTFFDTTTTTNCGILNFTSDNTWFPYYLESTWIPYHETKYNPKWHIMQSYKIQMETMWE